MTDNQDKAEMFCKEQEFPQNEHGQYIFDSRDKSTAINLPFILDDYLEYASAPAEKQPEAILEMSDEEIVDRITNQYGFLNPNGETIKMMCVGAINYRDWFKLSGK